MKSPHYNLFYDLWYKIKMWDWTIVFKSFAVEAGLFSNGVTIASLKVDGKTADWREQLTIFDDKLGANSSMHDLTSEVGI